MVNKSESYGPDSKPSMLLSPAQLDEFKAEGVLAIPGLVPPDVLDGWQDRMRAACSDGVDLDDPSTWPAGRYTPEDGWPELSPNLYDFTEPTVHRGTDRGRCFCPHPPSGAAVDAADSNDAGRSCRAIRVRSGHPLPMGISMGMRLVGAVGSWRSSSCCSGTSAALRAEVRPTGRGRT